MTKTFPFKIEVFHFNIFFFISYEKKYQCGWDGFTNNNNNNTFNLKVFLQNEDNLTFLASSS